MPTHASPTRRTPRPTRGRALYVPVVAALIAGSFGAWVSAATRASDRLPVALFGAFATIAAGVVAVALIRRARLIRRLQEQVGALDAQLRERTAAADQLADRIVPEMVGRLRGGASPDLVLAGMGPTGEQAHDRILRMVVTEIGRGERMRAAAMSACANAAGRVQALATSMLADLREMEDRHDEKVFGDLLRLDHSTAQAGRLADSIAVLTGARSGRRWTKPIVMESILRGAVGRISAYQRVRLHSTSTVAVAGFAAEGVMHALAELMDNATSFSPPAEEVHVYVEEVQTGVVVTIEDGGLVMGPAAQRRAEAAVSAEPLDLTALSGTRLGLAVVGVLARKHGLTVSFRPSSRGGTGVVVMIPRRLITQPRSNAVRPGRLGDAAGRDAVTDDSGAPGGGLPGGSTGTAGSAEPPNPTNPTNPANPANSANSADPVTDPLTGVAAAGSGGRGTPAGTSRAEAPGHRTQPEQAITRPVLPKRERGQTMAATTRPATPSTAKSSSRPRSDAGSRFGAFRQATRGTRDDAADTTGPGSSGPADRAADAREAGGS